MDESFCFLFGDDEEVSESLTELELNVTEKNNQLPPEVCCCCLLMYNIRIYSNSSRKAERFHGHVPLSINNHPLAFCCLLLFVIC